MNAAHAEIDRSGVALVSPNALPSTVNTPASAEPGFGESKRRNLVALLRGYFAAPVIASLGEAGIAERMLAGEFSAADWDSTSRRETVSALFRYLLSIGILKRGDVQEYMLTPEGRTALGRNGAFSLLMSYADYFHELPAALAGADSKATVNRLRNVRGSGQLHSRKFFPPALDFFSSEHPTGLIDIGCGDGCFLAHAHNRWPDIPLFGVDLSETAVEATQKRLGSTEIPGPLAVVANGFDVERWFSAVPEGPRNSPRLVISMWFVGHEFSEGSPEKMVDFFSAVYARFPRAEVILGEINNIPAEILAEDHDLSIMPEFLLFHELSGQGVLSWELWQKILSDIPYGLRAECRFDEVRANSGEMIPASFIWLLHPKPAINL